MSWAENRRQRAEERAIVEIQQKWIREAESLDRLHSDPWFLDWMRAMEFKRMLVEQARGRNG